MKVIRAFFTNFMGLEEYEFQPGKITKISAPNGAGKTSIINGLKDIIEGGHHAEFIREGSEEAIVGVEFSPQGKIVKKIKQNHYDLDIDKDDPLDDRTPMEYVRKMFSDFACNPVQFIQEPKKREEWLAQSLPIETSLEELQEAVGDLSEVHPKYASMAALDAIDRLYKLLYKSRRDHNRVLDEKSKSLNTFKKDIPEEIVDEDVVQEEIDKASDILNLTIEQRNEQIQHIDSSLQEQIQKLRERAEAKKSEIREEFQAEIDRHRDTVSELQTTLKHSASANASIKMFKKMEGEVTDLHKRRALYDRALTGLKELKASKLEEIPIEGVEIEDGELYKNGLHFDKLNRAQKIDLVMKIALLHAERQNTKIKMILLDDAEHLDEDSQAEIIKWVEALDRDDVMVIMTMVKSRDEEGNKIEGLQVETL